MGRKMIQVDFHPNGRVVYFYDDGTQIVKQFERGLTAKEALHKRLEEHKLNKVSEELIDEYDEAYKKLK